MLIDKKKIFNFSKYILEKIGLNRPDSNIIAELLIKADMSNHFSHGTIRLIQYHNMVENGIYSVKKKPILKKKDSFLNIDGKRSFGQITMMHACKSIIKTNKAILAASVVNTGHIGRLSDYIEILSNNGYVTLIFCNGGGPNTSIFPSKERLVGTNPFAFGLKINKKNDFIVDFATSMMAEGKINIARLEKKKLNMKPIIKKTGEYSNNYSDLYNGGSLRTFGGVKGSAFCLVNEILGGMLISKNNPINKNYKDGNNCFIIAMKKNFFNNITNFEKQFRKIKNKIKNGKRIKGVKSKGFLPGEIETLCFKKSSKKINYNKKLIIRLNKFAEENFNIPDKFKLI